MDLSNPPSLCVLVGKPLLVREAVEAIRATVATGPAAAFNHAVFTAGEEGALGFADVARSVPMMAPRRLVELRQVQDANAALLDRVLEYVQAPSPSTVLLVAGDKLPAASGGVDRGARIVNAVKKAGGLVGKLDGADVDPLDFARERARAWGAKLDRDAAALLVEMGGGDLSLLAADVEKCAGFVGQGGTIDRAVVTEVCASVAGVDRFALTNAIVAGDRARALEALHRQLEAGEPTHMLLAQIAWQLRQVLQIQDAARRGLPDSGARMPPRQAAMVRELVQKRPISPSAMLEELAAVNQGMNSSRAGDRRWIEALVLRLTGL